MHNIITAAGMILLLALPVSSVAMAEESDGTELLMMCEDTDTPTSESFYCMGYLSGVFDGLIGYSLVHPDAKPAVCVGQVRGEQLRLIVVKALKARPETLHFSRRVLVMAALTDAFPCK